MAVTGLENSRVLPGHCMAYQRTGLLNFASLSRCSGRTALFQTACLAAALALRRNPPVPKQVLGSRRSRICPSRFVGSAERIVMTISRISRAFSRLQPRINIAKFATLIAPSGESL